jgi:hypothetical protein
VDVAVKVEPDRDRYTPRTSRKGFDGFDNGLISYFLCRPPPGVWICEDGAIIRQVTFTFAVMWVLFHHFADSIPGGPPRGLYHGQPPSTSKYSCE